MKIRETHYCRIRQRTPDTNRATTDSDSDEREREREREREAEEEPEVLQLRNPYNSFTIAISITAWIIGTRSFLLGTF
jgi:hypothetical protein